MHCSGFSLGELEKLELDEEVGVGIGIKRIVVAVQDIKNKELCHVYFRKSIQQLL